MEPHDLLQDAEEQKAPTIQQTATGRRTTALTFHRISQGPIFNDKA
jgi:hypothetical protein